MPARRSALVWLVLGALAAASVGCRQILGIGAPDFGQSASSGAGGSGGTGSGTTAASGGGASASSASSAAGTGGGASSASSSGSGGATCSIGHLVISEIRSRGLGGPSDEFVELYNPTEAPVVLDGAWTLDAHALDPNVTSYSTRWTGHGVSIPRHGHFLITGSGFGDGIPSDDVLAVGLFDASSLRLRQNGVDVDVVCYYHAVDPGSASGFLSVIDYDCEGIPVANPHDDTSATNNDTSIERKPGGTAGNCTDTNSNLDDFVSQAPSTPEGTQDPPAP